MPVLIASNQLAPKSILRYRSTGARLGHVATAPAVPRASRLRPPPGASEDQQSEDDPAPATSKAQGRASRSPTTDHVPARTTDTSIRQARRIHPLLFLGVGMLAMLALWTVLSVAVTWAQTTLNDWHYGRPRTFQIDAFVGHNEQAGIPSHFIALNLNRHIQIIELPGGDPAHARIYSGPILYGEGDDLVPVTLSFGDVNGDDKLDLIVHFQDASIVFINDGTGFRPVRPDERPVVERWLRQH